MKKPIIIVSFLILFISLASNAQGPVETTLHQACRELVVKAISCHSTYEQVAEALGVDARSLKTIRRRLKIREQDCQLGTTIDGSKIKKLAHLEKELILTAVKNHKGDLEKTRKALDIAHGPWKVYVNKLKLNIDPSHTAYNGQRFKRSRLVRVDTENPESLEMFLERVGNDPKLLEKFDSLQRASEIYIQNVYEQLDKDLGNAGEYAEVPVLEVQEILEDLGYEFPNRRFSNRTGARKKSDQAPVTYRVRLP
ncbi:MAG: hypothetical protein AB7F43_12635 [Bacteriovoracia bacterium]